MNRVQIKLINDCLEYEDHLSEWETEFINNLANKDENYELTEKQNHRLNIISDKVNSI